MGERKGRGQLDEPRSARCHSCLLAPAWNPHGPPCGPLSQVPRIRSAPGLEGGEMRKCVASSKDHSPFVIGKGWNEVLVNGCDTENTCSAKFGQASRQRRVRARPPALFPRLWRRPRRGCEPRTADERRRMTASRPGPTMEKTPRLKIIFPLSFILLDRRDALEDGRGDEARRSSTPVRPLVPAPYTWAHTAGQNPTIYSPRRKISFLHPTIQQRRALSPVFHCCAPNRL